MWPFALPTDFPWRVEVVANLDALTEYLPFASRTAMPPPEYFPQLVAILQRELNKNITMAARPPLPMSRSADVLQVNHLIANYYSEFVKKPVARRASTTPLFEIRDMTWFVGIGFFVTYLVLVMSTLISLYRRNYGNEVVSQKELLERRIEDRVWEVESLFCVGDRGGPGRDKEDGFGDD